MVSHAMLDGEGG